MRFRVIRTAAWICLCACVALAAPEGKQGRGKGNKEQPTQNSKCNDVPAHPFDVVLGRPTRDSVTVSVLAYQDAEGCIAYGTQRGSYLQHTPTRQFKKGEPAEIVIGSLRPDTQYFYQLRARGTNTVEGAFHTQRSRGSSFTFTITADSHLDDRVSADVYQRTLANALADAPDFHVDLGDTFMTEKHENRDNAAKQYLAQRFYFGQLCRSAPLFLVLGNHDGEQPARGGSGPDSMAAWSNTMRKRYFPNPYPDGFYSGNANREPHVGLLENYYAWEWGDALFVVLDPFWFSARQRRDAGDNWGRTLGEAQYRWLARTLESSTARFKFLFIHHLAGGETPEGRGGAAVSHLFEWGGRELDGRNTFAQRRPGWPAPIHDLLVKHGASIVFHGHDHLYVREERDGIVYQEVPQPGHSRSDNTRSAAEYGYSGGVLQGNSGILRVSVGPTNTLVEYVRAYPAAVKDTTHKDGAVTHRYSLAPRTPR